MLGNLNLSSTDAFNEGLAFAFSNVLCRTLFVPRVSAMASIRYGFTGTCFAGETRLIPDQIQSMIGEQWRDFEQQFAAAWLWNYQFFLGLARLLPFSIKIHTVTVKWSQNWTSIYTKKPVWRIG
jgi:hypothetical protein